MRPTDAAVKLSVKDNPAADSGSNRHIDEPRLVLPGAPACLRHGCGIGIVFQRHLHFENASQVFHGILPAPSRKKIHFPKPAREWVHGTSRSNPYAGDLNPGKACRLAQHAGGGAQAVRVAVGIGGRFLARQYLPAIVHHTHRNFCSPNVNGPDHETFPCQFPTTQLSPSLDETLRASSTRCLQPLILLEASSHDTGTLRKYDSFAMWQASAA